MTSPETNARAPEKFKVLNCMIIKATPDQLRAEGWKQEAAFRSNDVVEWNAACDLADRLVTEGTKAIFLVNDPKIASERGATSYIFTKNKSADEEDTV